MYRIKNWGSSFWTSKLTLLEERMTVKVDSVMETLLYKIKLTTHPRCIHIWTDIIHAHKLFLVVKQIKRMLTSICIECFLQSDGNHSTTITFNDLKGKAELGQPLSYQKGSHFMRLKTPSMKTINFVHVLKMLTPGENRSSSWPCAENLVWNRKYENQTSLNFDATLLKMNSKTELWFSKH